MLKLIFANAREILIEEDILFSWTVSKYREFPKKQQLFYYLNTIKIRFGENVRENIGTTNLWLTYDIYQKVSF